MTGDGHDIAEREPSRFLHLYGPSEYSGELGKAQITQQINTDKVYVVNGFADKCDANFIS